MSLAAQRPLRVRKLEHYADLLERLGPHKASKGCPYLKRLDDVDLTVLAQIAERSYARARAYR